MTTNTLESGRGNKHISFVASAFLILLCSISALAQPPADTVISKSVTPMELPVSASLLAQTGGDATGDGKIVALGARTDTRQRNSRDQSASLGYVYAPNPELRSVLPEDFISFQAPDGTEFVIPIMESSVTRSGQLEVRGGSGDVELFAIVTEAGNFMADVETDAKTYRAMIFDGQTVVYASDDPGLSQVPAADDAPISELINRPAMPSQVLDPASTTLGANTVIALGVLLDNGLWNDPNVATYLDYYISALNTAYQQGGTNIRFELMAAANYQPYQDAAGPNASLASTRNWITCGSTDCQPLDGVNTAVDNWRNSVKADVVAQFVEYAASDNATFINWGIAQLPTSSYYLTDTSRLRQYTYSVSGLKSPIDDSFAGAYLVAHEVGHNFGLWHDLVTLESQAGDVWTGPDTFNSLMIKTYGRGHRFGESSGTSMSYAGNNVNKLSTPNVTDSGIAIGVTIGQPGEAFSAQAVADVMSYYKAVYNNAPASPSITGIEGEDEEILVSFTAGATGGLTITGYTVTCTDGQNSFQGSGTASPIAVEGVSNDVEYTCTVVATNPDGSSPASGSSAPVAAEAPSNGLPIWLLYEATQ